MLRKLDSVQWWKRPLKCAGLAGLILATGLVAAAPARAEGGERADHGSYHGGWGVYVSPGYPAPYYPYAYSYPYPYGYPYTYAYSYPYYYYGAPGYYYGPSVGFSFGFHGGGHRR